LLPARSRLRYVVIGALLAAIVAVVAWPSRERARSDAPSGESLKLKLDRQLGEHKPVR